MPRSTSARLSVQEAARTVDRNGGSLERALAAIEAGEARLDDYRLALGTDAIEENRTELMALAEVSSLCQSA